MTLTDVVQFGFQLVSNFVWKGLGFLGGGGGGGDPRAPPLY